MQNFLRKSVFHYCVLKKFGSYLVGGHGSQWGQDQVSGEPVDLDQNISMTCFCFVPWSTYVDMDHRPWSYVWGYEFHFPAEETEVCGLFSMHKVQTLQNAAISLVNPDHQKRDAIKSIHLSRPK